jgi:two-component system LytT family response regulator
MNTLRVLAVDDEVLALRRLRLLLQAIPYVEQVGEADGVRDALAKIDCLAPDVVLLDIRMRDGSGFDLVHALARRPAAPAIIFVSAFDRFAVRAFETSAVDYLLKPIERERLGQALQRARQRRGEADAEQRVAELMEIVRNLRSSDEGDPAYESEFWIRKGNGFVKVPVDSIEWVASEDEYVRLNSATGSYLMRGSIRQLESRLDPTRFLRIHRRWLVRKAAVVELRAAGMGRVEAVLRSGKRLTAGRIYGRRLREMVLQASADAGVGGAAG